ncbi:MAG: LPS O-antigen length regulator, partial [Gammaproteobacteria bacterium]|nr:LPS O-antigen length regulator [Gammaproteobacteria bacterium]
IEEAEKSIGYLEKQLVSTSAVEIQQAIYRLIEGQTKKKMVASTREEYAFTTIDPAVPPEKMAWPKRLLFILVGMALGLAFALIVAFWQSRQKGR